MTKTSGALICLLAAAGCAQTPPVVTTFPATRTSAIVRVVRTVGCDAKNMPVVASTVTAPTIVNAADHERPRQLRFARIDGELADSDIKLEFYGDGRLKGVNATTVGQGAPILKAAIKLAAVALEAAERDDVEASCKELKARFKDTPLTVAFETRDDLSGDSNGTPIAPDWQSAAYYDKFKTILGETCLRFGKLTVPPAPVRLERGGQYAMLDAQQPAQLEFAVAVGPVGNCEHSVIWSGIVSVAQRGTAYSIPIPKAAVFGTQSFATAFDEAGALTQLQYGKVSGTADALGTTQAAFEELQTTRAERTAGLKEEADLIAAQQKLVKCRTTPAEC